jgi:hypothetical protein
MTLNQIPKFEINNPTIPLTVISYDVDEIALPPPPQHVKPNNSVQEKMEDNEEMQARTCIPYNSKEEKPTHIDLMLLMKGSKGHFVLIKKFTPISNHRIITYKVMCRN